MIYFTVVANQKWVEGWETRGRHFLRNFFWRRIELEEVTGAYL